MRLVRACWDSFHDGESEWYSSPHVPWGSPSNDGCAEFLQSGDAREAVSTTDPRVDFADAFPAGPPGNRLATGLESRGCGIPGSRTLRTSRRPTTPHPLRWRD